MAKIPVQRQGELLRALFEVLTDHEEGLPARDAIRQVEQRVELTDFEKSDYPNRPGVRRFEKIVRFITIAPVKAGWMVKDKGQWLITEEGKEALRRYAEPAKLMRERAGDDTTSGAEHSRSLPLMSTSKKKHLLSRMLWKRRKRTPGWRSRVTWRR